MWHQHCDVLHPDPSYPLRSEEQPHGSPDLHGTCSNEYVRHNCWHGAHRSSRQKVCKPHNRSAFQSCHLSVTDWIAAQNWPMIRRLMSNIELILIAYYVYPPCQHCPQVVKYLNSLLVSVQTILQPYATIACLYIVLIIEASFASGSCCCPVSWE